MQIHEIHDLSNSYAIDILKNAFLSITDSNIVQNYHPEHHTYSGNLFNLLENGRYHIGNGKYFVIEEDGKYICSAGWNKHPSDPLIALALTRMFVDQSYRTKYHVGKLILPKILDETLLYSKVWITSNEYNKSIYSWFSRNSDGKSPTLSGNWPEIYKLFKPIGIHTVNYVNQYVAEFKR